jgi:hypothetical protein
MLRECPTQRPCGERGARPRAAARSLTDTVAVRSGTRAESIVLSPGATHRQTGVDR